MISKLFSWHRHCFALRFLSKLSNTHISLCSPEKLIKISEIFCWTQMLHTSDKSFFRVCSSVSVRVCCTYVSVRPTMHCWPFDWGASPSLCVHLDLVREVRLTFDLFCVVQLLRVRSSCQRVNEPRLSGAPWLLVKWPGQMTILCSDPCVSPWLLVNHPPPTTHTQRHTHILNHGSIISSGLYSCSS